MNALCVIYCVYFPTVSLFCGGELSCVFVAIVRVVLVYPILYASEELTGTGFAPS